MPIKGSRKKFKASGLNNLLDKTAEVMSTAPEKSIIFTNLVDFDEKFGHRRNAVGYAQALAEFDAYLPKTDSIITP